MTMNTKFTIANRIDITGTIIANNCLPNGDPNMSNSPRIDCDGFGLISDICQKFKLRRRVETLCEGQEGYKMLIVPTAIDNDCLDERVTKFTTNGEINIDGLCKMYFDIRAFGAVLISTPTDKDEDDENQEEKPKVKKTKQKQNTDHISGCVSVSFAKSVDVINAQEITLIRCCVQTMKYKEDGKPNTMGNKHIVNHAVYRLGISVNARRAAKNGFSDADLNILIDAIKTMFVGDESAARPAGSLDVGNLFVIAHNSIDGNESTAKIFSRLIIEGDSASFNKTNLPDGISVTQII